MVNYKNRRQRDRGPAPIPMDAYRIEVDRYRGSYTPVLTNTVRGGTFTQSPCGCARQAIYQVTRGGTRKMIFLGAFEMKAGEMVPVDLTKECSVPRHTEAWRNHGFTHDMKIPKVTT